MKEASQEFEWNLNLAEIARVWTNGCIIRSSLMETLSDNNEYLNQHLLLDKSISRTVESKKPDLIQVLRSAMQLECAMPVFSSALNYFLSFKTAKSPANLIQAQRDYFGAHTYQREDSSIEEYFHSNWKEML